jgi:hypothetical protein
MIGELMTTTNGPSAVATHSGKRAMAVLVVMVVGTTGSSGPSWQRLYISLCLRLVVREDLRGELHGEVRPGMGFGVWS